MVASLARVALDVALGSALLIGVCCTVFAVALCSSMSLLMCYDGSALCQKLIGHAHDDEAGAYKSPYVRVGRALLSFVKCETGTSCAQK